MATPRCSNGTDDISAVWLGGKKSALPSPTSTSASVGSIQCEPAANQTPRKDAPAYSEAPAVAGILGPTLSAMMPPTGDSAAAKIGALRNRIPMNEGVSPSTSCR